MGRGAVRRSIKESRPPDLTRKQESQACNQPGRRGTLEGIEDAEVAPGGDRWVRIAAGMSESSRFQPLQPSAWGPPAREGGWVCLASLLADLLLSQGNSGPCIHSPT